MANSDVVNLCKSTQPTKFGGMVVGVCGAHIDKKSETYEFKVGTNVLVMSASGDYNQTGAPNDSGVAMKYDGRFDKTRYYSGDTSA